MKVRISSSSKPVKVFKPTETMVGTVNDVRWDRVVFCLIKTGEITLDAGQEVIGIQAEKDSLKIQYNKPGTE